MARQVEHVPVAVPGFRALRVTTDASFSGIKDTFSLVRLARGSSEFWMQGRRWAGRPGSIVVQRAGDVHRDLEREGEIVYEMLRFPTGAIEHVIDNVRLDTCVAADDERGAPLRRLLDAVGAGADRFTLDCLLAEAIGALEQLREARTEHTRPVRRALAMIRERLADHWTLDELAQHAGLDKFHLCRAFRTQVGLPPHSYLTGLRIARAKELLAAGARPKDVAPQVGLYDQSLLNRHFRRIVGVTPGEFVRSSQ